MFKSLRSILKKSKSEAAQVPRPAFAMSEPSGSFPLARLYCKTGALAGERFVIRGKAGIGSASDNEVTLGSQTVSRHHALLYFASEAGNYFIEDLGSTNGTRLDGVPVKTPTMLEALHVITFGQEHDFIFQLDPNLNEHDVDDKPTGPGLNQMADQADTNSVDKTRYHNDFTPMPHLRTPDRTKPVDDFNLGAVLPDFDIPDQTKRGNDFDPSPVLPEADTPDQTKWGDDFDFTPPVPNFAQSVDRKSGTGSRPEINKLRYELIIKYADGTRAAYDLAEGEHTLGRLSSCDIPIRAEGVSRMHASITVRSNRITLKDLDSRNGTFVDGIKITTEVDIKPDQTISFGLQQEVRIGLK